MIESAGLVRGFLNSFDWMLGAVPDWSNDFDMVDVVVVFCWIFFVLRLINDKRLYTSMNKTITEMIGTKNPKEIVMKK